MTLTRLTWPHWLLVSGLLLSSEARLPAAEGNGMRNGEWDRSLVTLEVARNQFDYSQPWIRKPRRLKKTGLVVEGREILTTADQLQDRTMIRLQKGGRGRWWIGEIAWIDYHANLALLKVSEADFWKDLKPVEWGKGAPQDGNLQILRWNEGTLENRRAEFSRFNVRESPLSPLSRAMLECTSEIQNAGWGEPVVAGTRVAGILSGQDGRTCTAMPASFLTTVLTARRNGSYKGFGYFHFYWQQAENPTLLASLKLPGEPRGVVVDLVPRRPDGAEETIRPKDIILKIDGFNLDIQGDYTDPEFGEVMLENLPSRGKWAGEEMKLEIWRDGKPMDIAYRLPKFEYTNSLVPLASYDQEPEYLVVGGLLFQPLTSSFLQSWGPEWKRRAPFRLSYYSEQQPTPERPALVILSQVMPDPFNIGYQDQRYLVVDKVNGQPISRLADLQKALQKPVDGYHIIDFVRSDSLNRMVIDAGDAETQATARVVKRYGITKPSVVR
jgi:hypothetical protein